MKRRGFLGAIGAMIAGAAVATPDVEKVDDGFEFVAYFDEPITAITSFNNRVFVATGNKIYMVNDISRATNPWWINK